MAIVKETPTVVRATDMLVERFVNMPRHRQERPLSDDRLAQLRREFDAGRFRSPTWAEAYCMADGVEYRLNGQHTSVLYMGIPEASRPPVVHEKFIVETPFEVAELFSTYDPRVSARTCNDVTRAVFAMDERLGADGGVSARTSAVSVAAVALADQAADEWKEGKPVLGIRSRPGAHIDRARRVTQEADFVDFVRQFGGPEARQLLQRSPVVAAMFLTFKVDAASASTFWRAVVDGSDPAGAPSRLLRDFLLSRRVGTGSRQAATVREMAAKCVQAWNFWRRGEPLARLSFKEASLIPKPV